MTVPALPGHVLGSAREAEGRNIKPPGPTFSEPPAPAGEKLQQSWLLQRSEEDVQEPVRHAGPGWRRLAVIEAVISSRRPTHYSLTVSHTASYSALGCHALGTENVTVCHRRESVEPIRVK